MPDGRLIRTWVTNVAVMACLSCGPATVAGRRTPPATGSVVAIALGDGPRHRCALFANGRVGCEGLNWAGQLGGGTISFEPQGPVVVEGVSDVVRVVVSSSNGYSCALQSDGRVLCWGSNEHNQLGVEGGSSLCRTDIRTVPCHRSPVLVPGVVDAVGLSVSYGATCANTRAGRVFCWGRAIPFQGVASPALPVEIPGLGDVTDIRGAGADIYVRHANGAVVQHPRLRRFSEIESGEIQETSGAVICSIPCPGLLRCAGRSVSGQLGPRIETEDGEPFVAHVDGVRMAVFGAGHSCLVKTDGSVWCWGDASNGALGVVDAPLDACDGLLDEVVPCVRGPARVVGVTDARSVAVGLFSTCVVRADGSSWCWGQHPDGTWSPLPRLVRW